MDRPCTCWAASVAIQVVPQRQATPAYTTIRQGAKPLDDQDAWLVLDDEEIPLGDDCSIGRTQSNTLPLRDEKVSRAHARIYKQDDEYFVVDLGSANGTFVNGRRVVQPVQLKQNDVVLVGPFELSFRRKESASTSQPSFDESLNIKTILHVRSIDCYLLVADIIGSTQLVATHSSDALPFITGKWFTRCQEVIERNQGCINQYLGDGLFAYWQSKSVSPAQVAEGLRQLAHLQATEEPRFRFVLHFGPVSTGGVVATGEAPLFGQDVHYVFRMEKLAPQLNLTRMMSHSARELLSRIVPTQEVGQHPLSGMKGTHRFYSF
ncbi:MAG TPA: adenylate/guanylate cyclase domain-containing protein [Pseudomonadota bacterium]|nr:adenylate/guanylate cyclase domain-containing protein [Pseudomonadota bacterium]